MTRPVRTRFPAMPGILGVALAAALSSVAHAAARDSVYAEQRRALEAARYLREIEGDTAGSGALLARLGRSEDPGIRAQAQYLRAGFLEEAGSSREAARLYRDALESGGLEPAQERRLVARLLTLDPASVRPFRAAGSMRGLPGRVFASAGAGAGAGTQGGAYLLTEEAAGTSRGTRLYLQNADGDLQPLKVVVPADEEVLDAAPDRILTFSSSRQRVFLRRAPDFASVQVRDRFAAGEGALLAGDAEEFLLLDAKELRHQRGAQTLFTHALPGPGCAWRPTVTGSRRGIVLCPDRGALRVDLGRRLAALLPPGSDAASEALLSGEYLALRYPDRIEVRRAPGYETALWILPGNLQDAVALGRSHLFMAGADGVLRAFGLRTGQPEWQREQDVSALLFDDGELIVTSSDRTLTVLNERGRTLYGYEPSREGEQDPVLLPARDGIVVQSADGRRVRLDRGLLRIVGQNRDYLLRDARARAGKGDAGGAARALDSVLALEPGNGQAWREKARLLSLTGSSRAARARAWMQAARSPATPAWSADAALSGLADGVGASWAWKRKPGPRFFPVLTGGRQFSFYVENDNQTLIALENRTGAFRGAFRFPEPLDLKVAAWIGDTLLVSSPTHLYLASPARGTGILSQVNLPSPVCHSIVAGGALLLSDWNGGVRRFDPGEGRAGWTWETRVGRGGTLLARGGESVDAFEIEGAWHRLRAGDGKVVASLALPPGTITEVHAGRDFAYAGYNEGLLVAVDRNRGAIAWQKDMGEQIFSLSGRGDQFLLVGTASKRVLNIHGRTGIVQAQAQVPMYLFNRPLLAGDGYWAGTSEPALERRSLTHEVLQKYPLPGMPGTPSQAGGGVAVSTLDHFILVFPGK
jgi:outer membrane protein assembly factor BamB